MKIFTYLEELLILYAPVVLCYMTQIIDWTVTFKKFKSLDVNKQVAPLLEKVNEVSSELKAIKEEYAVITAENGKLYETVTTLQLTVENQTQTYKDLIEYLKAVSAENVALKAELRRKLCEAKEH